MTHLTPYLPSYTDKRLLDIMSQFRVSETKCWVLGREAEYVFEENRKLGMVLATV
jgi:hypothetical protein